MTRYLKQFGDYSKKHSVISRETIDDQNSIDVNGSLKINLKDFALFSARWLDSECGDCGGADLDNQEDVDFEDLCIFINNWLTGIE